MAETPAVEGVEAAFHNPAAVDVGYPAKDLADPRTTVLGTSTVSGGARPLVRLRCHLFRVTRPLTKFAFVLSPYGWGGGAVKRARELLGVY